MVDASNQFQGYQTHSHTYIDSMEGKASMLPLLLWCHYKTACSFYQFLWKWKRDLKCDVTCQQLLFFRSLPLCHCFSFFVLPFFVVVINVWWKLYRWSEAFVVQINACRKMNETWRVWVKAGKWAISIFDVKWKGFIGSTLSNILCTIYDESNKIESITELFLFFLLFHFKPKIWNIFNSSLRLELVPVVFCTAFFWHFTRRHRPSEKENLKNLFELLSNCKNALLMKIILEKWTL